MCMCGDDINQLVFFEVSKLAPKFIIVFFLQITAFPVFPRICRCDSCFLSVGLGMKRVGSPEFRVQDEGCYERIGDKVVWLFAW